MAKRPSVERVIGDLKSVLTTIEPRGVKARTIKHAIFYLEGNPVPGEHCGKGDGYRECEAPELCVPAGCCFRA